MATRKGTGAVHAPSPKLTRLAEDNSGRAFAQACGHSVTRTERLGKRATRQCRGKRITAHDTIFCASFKSHSSILAGASKERARGSRPPTNWGSGTGQEKGAPE